MVEILVEGLLRRADVASEVCLGEYAIEVSLRGAQAPLNGLANVCAAPSLESRST